MNVDARNASPSFSLRLFALWGANQLRAMPNHADTNGASTWVLQHEEMKAHAPRAEHTAHALVQERVDNMHDASDENSQSE